MFKNIMVAIDLNDETSWSLPLLSAVQLARTFGAQLHVFTVLREVEAILQAKAAALGYDPIITYLEHELASRVRQVEADDLHLKILVTLGASIYAEILAVAESAAADLVVVGSHRPAMKDYLLGTNASRVVRHARCSVLVARDIQDEGFCNGADLKRAPPSPHRAIAKASVRRRRLATPRLP